MNSIVGRLGLVGPALAGQGLDVAEGAPSPPSADVLPMPRRAEAPDYAGMLAAIRAGDAGAETQLLQALTAPLQVVLRHRARYVESVDDLCQEALIAVLQAARQGRVSNPTVLVEYALQTARQLAMNAERKRSRRQTTSVAEIADTADETQREMGELIDEQRQSEKLRTCVDTVLASMHSERDRQLLHSYYLNETSSADLQAQMTMNSQQFGKVLHRARQRFSQIWQALKYDASNA